VSEKQMTATILIRCSVGAIFLSEGIQKFLFPMDLGVGRFAKIGIPMPEILAPMVGSFEIICGVFVLLGLAIRLAVIPLICVITTAIIATKIPILIKSGFFKMAHEARTDYAMLLSLIFLLVVGAGKYSIDALISNKKELKEKH
jgi:putative oxidoreductase